MTVRIYIIFTYQEIMEVGLWIPNFPGHKMDTKVHHTHTTNVHDNEMNEVHSIQKKKLLQWRRVMLGLALTGSTFQHCCTDRTVRSRKKQPMVAIRFLVDLSLRTVHKMTNVPEARL